MGQELNLCLKETREAQLPTLSRARRLRINVTKLSLSVMLAAVCHAKPELAKGLYDTHTPLVDSARKERARAMTSSR